MSATHSWFAAVTVKSRSTRSRRVSGPSPASVIRGPSFSGDPAKSFRRHQSLPGAARDHDAFSAQLSVELLRPVDPEVLRLDTANLDQQLHVPNRPLQGRAGLESVVGARRDLGARCGERAADRLDAQLLFVLVVVPGRWPSSISACRTHVRNVSGWIPSCSPTRRNAAGLVGWIQPHGHSRPRGPSRSSSGYFFGADTVFILPWDHSLYQTRGDTRRDRDSVAAVGVHGREDAGLHRLVDGPLRRSRRDTPPLADPGDRDRRLGDELWQDPPHHRVQARSSGLDR